MPDIDLTPVEVERINTKYRTIKTALPVPESVPMLKELMESEPQSMRGQHPIIWNFAHKFSVEDLWGNKWIDWSSGVLIANAGHNRLEIYKAITHSGIFGSTYAFAHENRIKLCRELQRLSPIPSEYSVALFTTGSEAVEAAIRVARSYSISKEENNDQKKHLVVSFNHAFHGRTLGSILAGGKPAMKKWTRDIDKYGIFAQVPFPDGYKNKDVSFGFFLQALKEKNIKIEDIAAVIVESYQGGGPDFMPVKYAKGLQHFCRINEIVMIVDEVQAGFGRTGKMFGYEHYGISPDLIVCAKGLSSSLPISAVIGRKEILDSQPVGSMNSTHGGNPLSIAASLASLKLIKEEKLVENARIMGEILLGELKRIQAKHPDSIGCVQGLGLVAGMQMVKRGTQDPDGETAAQISRRCFQKGVLMFAPAGVAGECVKISPPLVINEEALREGISALEEACDEVLGTDRSK